MIPYVQYITYLIVFSIYKNRYEINMFIYVNILNIVYYLINVVIYGHEVVYCLGLSLSMSNRIINK